MLPGTYPYGPGFVTNYRIQSRTVKQLCDFSYTLLTGITDSLVSIDPIFE